MSGTVAKENSPGRIGTYVFINSYRKNSIDFEPIEIYKIIIKYIWMNGCSFYKKSESFFYQYTYTVQMSHFSFVDRSVKPVFGK